MIAIRGRLFRAVLAIAALAAVAFGASRLLLREAGVLQATLFEDRTPDAGIGYSGMTHGAAWGDVDRDGRPDLYVTNHLNPPKLYHNLGGGRFEEAGQKAGVADPTSKSLGVTVFDYNGDSWPDIFVANDTQPNKLYRNNKNGTFTEEGMSAGVAFGEDGVARGAMGVDVADYDRSGRPHLIVGNFSNQMLGLYHNEGTGLFVDEAPSTTVGRASLLSLAFGVFFFDYDLDGHPDILTANGHLEEEIQSVQPKVSYKEPPLLFRNLGKRKFENASNSVGAEFARPMVARGAAYGDLDRDGDLDVVFSTNHGPGYVFRNDGGKANNWVCIRTQGTKSNRDGIGAVVRVESPSGKQWNAVRSGSSYCSQSDLALTFGLGKDPQITAVEIEWPSGTKQRLTGIPVNQFVVVDEAKGVVSKSGPAK
jgi:hypothetical protein